MRSTITAAISSARGGCAGLPVSYMYRRGVCNPNLSTSLREAFATLMLMSDDPFLSGLCPGECDITACVCGEVQR